MSTYRTKQDRKKVEGYQAVKKDPETGRPLCRLCGGLVPKPRRSFCSAECVHEWQIRSSVRYARYQVYKRDKAVCQACCLDCSKLKKHILSLPKEERLAEAAKYGIPKHRIYGSYWDVDHIHAVALGGGESALSGLQTLCVACHKEKTKHDLKLIRDSRQKTGSDKGNDGNAV